MSESEHEALETAARDAMRAPSVFNTQPWAWRIDGTALELRADWSRQLNRVDPDGHFLLLSCGAALHHARAADPAVRRLAIALLSPLPKSEPALTHALADADPEVRLTAAEALLRRALGPRPER
jgi:hypothetical protein